MPILNMIAQGSGGGGGGSNVGEPTNLFAIVTSNSTIDIRWTDNNLQAIPPSTFQKSVLVRKVGSAPTTPSDGTTVVTETVMNTYQSSAYTDTGLTQGTTYYYQVFSYSTDGGITYGTPVSLTPGGWTPGANTVAYYPLDSVNQLADLSGNGNTLTKDGTVMFTDNYASFFASGRLDTPITSTPTNQTVIFWMMYESGGGNEQTLIAKWGSYLNNYRWGLYISNSGSLKAQINDSWTNVDTLTDNTWYMVVQTTEGVGTANCNFKVYINGNTTPLVNQTAPLYNDSSTYIRMGGRPGTYNFVGRLSGVIIEDKVRTAQEIAYYYDSIKANYGIS